MSVLQVDAKLFAPIIKFGRCIVPRETVHIVQAYSAGRGAHLKPEAPIPCKSAELARRTAERLAESKLGVVAFSSSGDPELGEYDDEPTIIFKSGRLPPQFEE